MTLRALPLLLVLVGCGPEVGAQARFIDDAADVESFSSELRLSSQDRAETIDVASWNVEWFGSPNDGPTDDPLQQTNVAKVLRQTNLDLVGLVEVVDAAAFQALLAVLPAYDGLLVTDPRVQDGAAWYSTREQKVALLFKRRFTVDAARVVVTEAAYDFGGRPPMEVSLSFTEAGAPRTLVVVVAHFKAMANLDGWTRRTRASVAFKAWLDQAYPSRWVLVVGDWNDDLDVSTYRAQVSPFSNFVADPSYRFATDGLTARGEATTVGFASTIDHHLATQSLARRLVADSARVLRPERVVPDYGVTTSDHYPVMSRYDLW